MSEPSTDRDRRFAEVRSLRKDGRLAEAESRLIELFHGTGADLDVFLELGDFARVRSDLPAAAQWYQRAVETAPECFAARCNLGTALRALGQLQDAARHLREAVRIEPRSAAAHNNLALVLLSLGERETAIQHFRTARETGPEIPDIHVNLGSALLDSGDLRNAEASLRRALLLRPSYAEALNRLGMVLYLKREFGPAREAYRRAIALKPDLAEIHYNLGNLLRDCNELDEAIACFEKAARLRPGYATALSNLAEALQTVGRIEESEAVYRTALSQDPAAAETVHENLLFCMNYNPHHPRGALFAEHTRWAQRYTSGAAIRQEHANTPDPERRLRVGYVSPDFCAHPASYFLEPLLRNHCRDRIEALCFSNVKVPDRRTARFREWADQWREVNALGDGDLAQAILRDRVDILVDCAGHCSGNRLPVFAGKPAPIQVSFLGYPNTTGLTTIDYRFADEVTDPAEEEYLYTERLVRLKGGFCCYAPIETAPEVSSLPALKAGRITFGSLHNLARLNSDVIALWSEILRQIPGSRLLAVRTSMTPGASGRILDLFAGNGIDPRRIVLRKTIPEQGHLAVYHEIDIALDTFPWSGHTTACEGLWMGVPMVTLRGDRHAGRMVASVLHYLGMPHLVADTPDDYVKIAVGLSRNLDALADLRSGLRMTMQSSPLCDGNAYAAAVEEEFRTMWKRWCSERSS